MKNLIDNYGEVIIEATIGTPLFPSVKFAQLCLETGYGRSIVGNNLFGIKGRGKKTPFWDGSIIYADTKENVNGTTGTYNEPFRNYKSQTDSVRDHNHLLLTLSRYRIVRQAQTPEAQARALQQAGYATDANYANKLINIINKYNLKTLDEKKKLCER
ncbi:MAG: glucosaminidase domain-containing protein [Lentimicrobiaceae bacterium]|nr:glucosaminidase domain-containing protein [Lentimicrobiaceae bacterium]